jgi:hypothetical protein|tara:strand:+ start:68 stop:304 length:237 start_codon:yes stop_codon:yes gene_type:complete
MDLEKEQQRGQRAKAILEDEIFVEALQKIRQDLELQWLNSDIKDSEQRENIFLMRRMIEVVVMQLQSVLETGKLATKK